MPSQVSFVDGPYGRDGGGHVFFVRGKKLQFVERARLQVSAARHPVEALPACLYPVAVGIGIEVCVNGIGIRHIDTRYVEGIGSEERSVNADVPLVHGIQTLCVFADTVVEQGVPQQQLLILACDAVHFWSMEDEREKKIDDTYRDDYHQSFPQQAVYAQTERFAHLFVCQRLRIEPVFLSRHPSVSPS